MINEKQFWYVICGIVTIILVYYMTNNWIRTTQRIKIIKQKVNISYALISEICSTISYSLLLTMLWITTTIGMSSIQFTIMFMFSFISLFIGMILHFFEIKKYLELVERGKIKMKNESKKHNTKQRKT
jgi:uncharacterized membrane protein